MTTFLIRILKNNAFFMKNAVKIFELKRLYNCQKNLIEENKKHKLNFLIISS